MFQEILYGPRGLAAAFTVALLLTCSPRTQAQTGTLTVLHGFRDTDTMVDAADPTTGLVRGNDGKFYGATEQGGVGGGAVFSVTTTGATTILHSFSAVDTNNVNADGAQAEGGLFQASDGNFYGTTVSGGAYGKGTVFRITPGGALTTLCSFGPLDASGAAISGANSFGGVVQGSDGNFYGTTNDGGGNGSGTFFRVTPAGVLTALYSFAASNRNDTVLRSRLIQASDGNFYGLTSGGDIYGNGVVFRITPGGAYTVLHGFSGDEGAELPGGYNVAGLIQARDGNFYGTVPDGGVNSAGTLFRMTLDGTVTVLYSFGDGIEGTHPRAALVQGSDGNFYGTTSAGGSSNSGGVFSITAAGVVTDALDLYYGSEGYYANTLLEGTDGNFYGTTEYGGDVEADDGTVFQFNPGDTPAAAAPVLISDTHASAQFGVPFVYQIAATQTPSSYTAGGLPAGLEINASTGQISGTPTGAAGTSVVGLGAINASGTGPGTLILTVNPPLPTVSLTVLGDGRAEFGVENGKAAVRRTGSLDADLTVLYEVIGTAQAGVDYKAIGGTVTIPAGAAQAKIKIKPLLDPANTGKLKAKIVLLPARDGSYGLDGPRAVKINVIGSE